MENLEQIEAIEELLEDYYSNNAKKLHKMIDSILLRFGGISNKDMDDFYSLANEVFTDILKRYDISRSFDAFLYSCLTNKIMSEFTKRNRDKHKVNTMSMSLDSPIGDEDGLTIGDILAGSFDMEKEIFGDVNAVTFKLEKYLATLSRKQKKILELLSYYYRAAEIQELLHITQKEYEDALDCIHSYEKIKILL